MPFSALQKNLDERAAKGLLRQRQTLASQQSPRIQVESRAYLSFCSNDYLGLGGHPEIVKALNHAAPHLRHLLGAKIDMKFTPALVFRADESFAEARRIDELLASPAVARDLKQ